MALFLVGAGQAWAQARPATTFDGKPVNGFTWKIEMPTAITTFDALEVDCGLFNTSDRQLTFETRGTKGRLGHPKLILTARGKKPLSVELKARDGFRVNSGNYRPKPGEVADRFSTDLRRFFGQLPAGEYTFQVVFPKAAYLVKDAADFRPADIASAAVPFTVTATTVAAAAKDIPKGEVQFTTDRPAKGKAPQHGATGTITNRSKVAVEFHAYVWGHKATQPLCTIMTAERWHPKTGWATVGPLGWCGTGLGKYKLQPGASVTVTLIGGEGDGLYRYVVRYGGEGNDTFSRQLFSEPFVVDNLLPIPNVKKDK
jgi:hypothetical protein